MLRLQADGTARVTMPRRSSPAAARAFAERHLPWLEKQLQRLAQQPGQAPWQAGTTVFLRGLPVTIEVPSLHVIRLGTEIIRQPFASGDLRHPIQRHLRLLATRELPPRVRALAKLHGIEIGSVTVRNQKSRWGSCSRRGTISLNWRLIQTPEFVRDYIILHELAHRRQMNHSPLFWQEVARLCPGYEAAEHWIKKHAKTLL